MRRYLLVIILAAGTLFQSQNVVAWSLLGAESLDFKTRALHVQVGQPGVDATFHIPITKLFEVAPKVGLYFAPSFLGEAFKPGHVGNRFGADLKYLFLKKGRLYAAFHIEPALFINYNPLLAGIQFGIPGGVKVNYELQNGMNVSAGIAIPIAVTFTDPSIFVNPINFSGGIEIPFKKTMNLSFLLEVGPVIIANSESGRHTGLNLRALVGVGILL